jgi:hypothetical protein
MATDIASNDWRESAIKRGFPTASNSQVAAMLLNLAERGTITVSFGVVAALVEAAARLDGDQFIDWERERRMERSRS